MPILVNISLANPFRGSQATRTSFTIISPSAIYEINHLIVMRLKSAVKQGPFMERLAEALKA
jgi:hypothetical protein